MRMFFAVAVMAGGIVLSGAALAARADDVVSGPQVGDHVGAFEVVKAAGAAEDGIPVGKELCYRCKLGQRPVVMVFARTPDANLAKLTKELDKVVAKNADQKMASFVNLLGQNADELKKKAHDFVAQNKLQNIAFVVPGDLPNGPTEYKINEKADVTVLIYRNGKVAANHAFSTGKLSGEAIENVVADTSKILKLRRTAPLKLNANGPGWKRFPPGPFLWNANAKSL